MQLGLKAINPIKISNNSIVVHKTKFLLFIIFMSYAFFSSSTPDEFGIQEGIIAVSLVLLFGIWGILLVSSGSLLEKSFVDSRISILYMPFLYFLTVPSIVGFLNGNNFNDFIRDFIPFLYLAIPLFMYDIAKGREREYATIIIIYLCITGVSYSIRHFFEGEFDIKTIGKSVFFGWESYFVMDPAVLFSATFLINYGYIKVTLEKKVKDKVVSLIYVFFGSIAYLSIIVTVVRAQIVLVLFSLFISSILLFKRTPINIGLFLLLTIIAIYILIGDIIYGVTILILEKTYSVGLNSRELEFMAVIDYVLQSVHGLIFGYGWGAIIETPTAGKVRFTHNIFSYFLLKSGIIGGIILLLILSWIYALTLNLIRKSVKDYYFSYVVGISILNVLLINTLLEAVYKSLSFGFILTLLLLINKRERKIKNMSKG